MTDTPKDPPELTSDNKDCAMTTDHDEPHSPPDDTPPPEPPKENLIHFNPWRDFNDAASVTGRLWSREKCKTKPLPHLFDWQVRSASLVYSWKNCVSDCFDHRVLSRTGVMLPSVVGASAATSCQVQKRFPCAYLRRRPQNGGLGTSGFTASSGTASRVGTSVNQRHRARPNSFLFVFDDKGYLGK